MKLLPQSTFQNLLLGLAIGDAYGAGLEFRDRNWIREHVDFSRFYNERNDIPEVIAPDGSIIQGYRDWEYTDDTEMTLGCIKALLSREPLSEKLLQKLWIEEYESDKQRKGYGRHGHGSMRWVFNGEKTIEEIQDFQRNRPNPGNGAVMRILPFAFLPEKEINAACILSSNATHPNPRSSAASITVARTCYYLLFVSEDRTALVDYLLPHLHQLDEEMSASLEKIKSFPPPDQLTEAQFEVLCGQQPIVKPWYKDGLYGLPSDAMYTALSAVYLCMHCTDTFDGLKASIRFGGDVDSLASIVTGILGAKYGIDSLPAYMKENVEGKAMLEEIAGRMSEL